SRFGDVPRALCRSLHAHLIPATGEGDAGLPRGIRRYAVANPGARDDRRGGGAGVRTGRGAARPARAAALASRSPGATAAGTPAAYVRLPGARRDRGGDVVPDLSRTGGFGAAGAARRGEPGADGGGGGDGVPREAGAQPAPGGGG